MWKRLLVATLAVLLLASIILPSGCTSEQSKPSPKESKASAEQNKETDFNGAAVFVTETSIKKPSFGFVVSNVAAVMRAAWKHTWEVIT